MSPSLALLLSEAQSAGNDRHINADKSAVQEEGTGVPGRGRLSDNLLRVFDSEFGARGVAKVRLCFILGGRVGLVWIVGEMNHTELQRVIWRVPAATITIDNRIGGGCEEAKLVPTMLRLRETRCRVEFECRTGGSGGFKGSSLRQSPRIQELR